LSKLPIALAFTAGAAVASAVAMGVVSGGSAHAASPPAPTAVREVLATSQPRIVPGYTLSLQRVTAAPGAQLPKHYHPGFQDVYILSGRTAYTVYKGTARVFHGSVDGTEKLVQTITAGHTGTLRAGDWFAETPGLVHSAAVKSKTPFVVLQASLLKTGQPLAIPVK
jgi:quercetin dioxygenase-like cupin family protein